MGGAVDAATAGSDAVDIELDDAAVGEEPFEFLSGGVIGVGVAELGCDHGAVADIEVYVARGEVIRSEFRPEADGRLEHDYLKRTPLGIGRRLEDAEMAHGHFVVERLRIRVKSRHDDAGADEAGIEVGVAIGDVLTGDAR